MNQKKGNKMKNTYYIEYKEKAQTIPNKHGPGVLVW